MARERPPRADRPSKPGYFDGMPVPPAPPIDTTGEPGRASDHLSSLGEGPGQTPLEDVIPGIILVAVAAIALPIVAIVAFLPGTPVAIPAVFVPVGLVFLLLGIWLIRRGAKRWAWRKAHAHLTGGRYLRPWEKTPDSY